MAGRLNDNLLRIALSNWMYADQNRWMRKRRDVMDVFFNSRSITDFIYWFRTRKSSTSLHFFNSLTVIRYKCAAWFKLNFRTILPNLSNRTWIKTGKLSLYLPILDLKKINAYCLSPCQTSPNLTGLVTVEIEIAFAVEAEKTFSYPKYFL